MSFLSVLIEYKWTILFYLIIILLVYLNRKRFDIQAKIIALYRTKIGVRFIDRFVKGKEKLIKMLGTGGIVLGYIGMIAVFYLLFLLLYNTLKQPTVISAAPVIPGVPLAGTGLKFPLIIGWISLLIIIVIHEFSHGIVAKAYKQKIKSTGIAFFGPILGAFVEIDEKKLQKQPDKVQNSVFTAGPNANIITSIIFLLLLNLVVAPAAYSMIMPMGVGVEVIEGLPANMSGLRNNDVIVGINNHSITTIQDFIDFGYVEPNQTYTFYTEDSRVVEVTARPHPDNESRGQFGINMYTKTKLKNPTPGNKVLHAVLLWIGELLFWLFLIGINIGLINFLPIFITDGARMLQISLRRIIKDKDNAKRVWLFINKFSLLILLLIIVIPIMINLFKWLISLA
ncbi:hypothetical protein AYK26_02970 [Euryarchaeota archaeon SM23-78]|nr:MAG: hypothetical protein AYK26_02970 [Euryarchaeota archaeon SM23-78]MBW3000406.1 site-2 protease family protein [Candidatus Woesearchaeota archaeon]